MKFRFVAHWTTKMYYPFFYLYFVRWGQSCSAMWLGVLICEAFFLSSMQVCVTFFCFFFRTFLFVCLLNLWCMNYEPWKWLFGLPSWATTFYTIDFSATNISTPSVCETRTKEENHPFTPFQFNNNHAHMDKISMIMPMI